MEIGKSAGVLAIDLRASVQMLLLLQASKQAFAERRCVTIVCLDAPHV